MIQGTRMAFSEALSFERLSPFGKASKDAELFYWSGVLNTLYAFRNNFMPAAFVRTAEIDELERQINVAIFEINRLTGRKH